MSNTSEYMSIIIINDQTFPLVVLGKVQRLSRAVRVSLRNACEELFQTKFNKEMSSQCPNVVFKTTKLVKIDDFIDIFMCPQ